MVSRIGGAGLHAVDQRPLLARIALIIAVTRRQLNALVLTRPATASRQAK